MALHSIATPHSTTAADKVQVRRTRSANTPKGTAATAPTNELTATRSPISVLLMWRWARSSMAEAPTVAVSALLSASTPASTRTICVRADPPSTRFSRETRRVRTSTDTLDEAASSNHLGTRGFALHSRRWPVELRGSGIDTMSWRGNEGGGQQRRRTGTVHGHVVV